MANTYYDQHYFKQRDLLDVRSAYTIKYLMQKYSFKKVLDVGCGTGQLVKYLTNEGFFALGCDKSIQALKQARRINKPNSIYKASVDKLPFSAQSFDIVTAISVIEHLNLYETNNFIKEIIRVLRPGGCFFLLTPNFASPFRLLQGKKWLGFTDPTHIKFFTPGELSNLLKINGFTDIKTRFKTNYNIDFDWDLPGFLRKLPKPIKGFLIYLLSETTFSNLKNAFWMSAQKK